MNPRRVEQRASTLRGGARYLTMQCKLASTSGNSRHAATVLGVVLGLLGARATILGAWTLLRGRSAAWSSGTRCAGVIGAEPRAIEPRTAG